MPHDNLMPVHLRRIDLTRNMKRFYVLWMQPTLFGGASVMRNWGRIGSSGRSMVQTFDVPEEATDALDRLERSKRQRGYCDAGMAERSRGVVNSTR